jgi:pimeloyl-ACP methyl ester carboxylesterase
MQIPYLARHCRVVTFDGHGNGRSDRPAADYAEREFAADALAVMDATGTGRAVIVSLSLGAQRALLLAAGHADPQWLTLFRAEQPERAHPVGTAPGPSARPVRAPRPRPNGTFCAYLIPRICPLNQAQIRQFV